MLQECSAWRVLRVFFDDPLPEGLGLPLREVSRRSGLAHTSVKKHLQTLEEEGLVKTREKQAGSRSYPVYLADRESENFRRYKSIDMVYRIFDTGLLKKLVEKAMPDCIVLFGSAARGEDTADSDVDLYLQCSEKDFELSEYEKALRRDIQLHFRPEFNSFPPELKNNIVNGIKLYGYLEVY